MKYININYLGHLLFRFTFYLLFAFLRIRFRDGVVFEKSLQIQKESVALQQLINHPE